MTIAEKVTTGPVLSVLAAAATAVASVGGLASSLGLPPFLADASGSTVFFALAVYWAYLSGQARKPMTTPGFVREAGTKKSTGLINALPYYAVSAAFIALACWLGYPAVSTLLHPHWKVCGTVIGGCSPSFCATGLDSRSRPIFPECIAPLDNSGYLELKPKTSLTYRPESIRIQCAGKDLPPLRVPAAFNSAKCDARLELP